MSAVGGLRLFLYNLQWFASTGIRETADGEPGETGEIVIYDDATLEEKTASGT